MPSDAPEKFNLGKAAFGSLITYELSGEYIVGRLLGAIPLVKVHLGAVHYLRLAAQSEAPPLLLLFNWIHFMPHLRRSRPVYVLQTRSRHRIFLKLDGTTHFRLRQAINRHTPGNGHLKAA